MSVPSSVLVSLAVLALLVPPANAQSPVPPEALHDAELTSVTFADADHGWAVGDHGVVWHTIDGGRNWQQQDSQTTVRLESVWFADAETGWAVGGSHHPYTHHGIGVVLRTVDGGATWQNVPGTNLPALKRVKFFGPRQGFAIGESSGLYPGGVFLTADGGRTWSTLVLQLGTPEAGKPSNARSPGNWVAGDFLNPQGGLVASAAGAVANVTALDLQMSDRSVTSQRCPQAMRVARDGKVWLCGERGLLLCSADAGATWLSSPYLPQAAAGQFDFAALTTLGQHVWVAGNPGSILFHSPDAGQTWEMLRTGCSTPLSSLCFLDESRGWAAGALGKILHTRDGGRSWRVQRQGGTKAALLAIVSEPGRVPHEMLVQQAGNEGYVSAVEILTRSDSRDDAISAARSREAMSTLLATHTNTAWQFPVPPLKAGATLEQLLASWDAAGEGKQSATQRLEEYLVRRIRTWQPEVIVTEDAHPGHDNPLAHLTNQVVLAAAAKAADPAAFREQIEQAGLSEWKVKKVFATVSSTERQGDIKLVCSQLAPRVGASLVDVADEARGQLDDTYKVGPASRGFALLVDHLPQGQGRRDFFSGISLLSGSEARRPLSNPPVPDFASLSKQIQKRQMLQGLLERSEKYPLRGQAWLAQVTEMTRGLPPASSARIMYHLGQRYQASGESELAAEVMNTLVEKHADHPLADAALLWLIHYYASAEAAHRLRGQTHFAQPAVAVEPLEAPPRAVKPTAAALPTGNRVAIAKGVSAEAIEPNNRLERALALGKLLEKNRPALSADPSVRFTLLNARTKTPSPSLERERILQSLAASKSSGDWAECAKAELFIGSKGNAVCPKRNFLCKLATSKPKLDGRLDDEIWQSSRSLSLRETIAPGEPLESIAAIAHDDEFLYVAISCRRSPEFEYAPEERTRMRDADLQSHDRVELLIDTDRDYASYYRLAIDHRGWTSESCFSDATWNPIWYVAAAGDETHWTIETAIPLAELTADKTLKKNYWAVGLQRVVPGTTLQSWTPDAELDIRPEGFGLMKFE